MQAQPQQIMPAPRTVHRAHWRDGFALPVVLGGLLLVTALFATAQMRSLGQFSQITAERDLLTQTAGRREMLDLAMLALEQDPQNNRVLLVDGSGRSLVLQDVGGLIDLNTAHPDLLDRLCQTLALNAECLDTLRAWRRTGRRLLSVQDFVRIVGLQVTSVEDLPAVATVFSGRFGVDPGSAPASVLEIARGDAATLDEAFADQPTSTTFAIWLVQPDKMPARYLGTIQKAPSLAEWRVLDLN